MPGLNTRGTTYNMPNYHGVLTQVSPTDTPFFSAIAGLSDGGDLAAKQFEWQFDDLRNAGQNVALEGADAPAPNNRTRFALSNITQIHHETIDVSYSHLAAMGQFAGINVGAQPDDPSLNEMQRQLLLAMLTIKRDVEYSFVQGTYQAPSDNTTTRKTRGILAGITTNVIAKAGTPAPAKVDILDLLQTVWTNGGISQSETATLMANASMIRWITKLFITDANYQETTRVVGGVTCKTIMTDFGTLNVMLNRYMPTDQIAVVSLEECEPRYTPIPGKGVFFAEPLAKIGSSERLQVYGEIGLHYGNERKHGKITGYNPAAPTS